MTESHSTTTGRAPFERAKAWDSFEERLGQVIGKLMEDHALIIQEKGTNRFVQFLGQGADGLRVEAVSNAYLSSRDQYSEAQLNSLLALGWGVPTGSPEVATPHAQPEGSPNFVRQFRSPAYAGEAAALAVATLADVMRIPHPGFLSYDGLNVDTGSSLTWNELKLKRSESRSTLAEAAEQLLLTLRAETGNEALDFDEDGDIPLRYGSVMVFARIAGEAPSVRLHAPVLLGVAVSRELLVRLNELNCRVVRPVFVHASDCVVAVADIPAAPYDARHVARALNEFCALTDGIDELLQGEFGGRTAFTDSMFSSTKVH